MFFRLDSCTVLDQIWSNFNKMRNIKIVKNTFAELRRYLIPNFSSIGNGGINTKCAETTNMKKCAKIKVGKMSGMPRSNPKVKCQGQIPRSRISGMPRSNPKVKNFRNAKVKSQGQEFQECVNRKKPEKKNQKGLKRY